MLSLAVTGSISTMGFKTVYQDDTKKLSVSVDESVGEYIVSGPAVWLVIDLVNNENDQLTVSPDSTIFE